MLDETDRTPGKVLAGQVRRYREKRGLTQRQVKERLEERFGVLIDAATIARLERGDRRITVDEACLLAVVLNVPLMALMWPIDESEPVSVAPGVEAAPWEALEWAVANNPLPGVDDEEWNSATQPLVDLAQLLDAVYYADFQRRDMARGGDRAEYTKSLQRLAGSREVTEEIGVSIEGIIPSEVLADLEEAIKQAPMRRARMRPRRGGES